MSTDIDLTLAQWFSPGFPVGSFSFSHGLEAAIASGEVINADSCAAWLHDLLTHGTGMSDALFLAASYHRTEDADEIDAMQHAFCTAASRRRESLRQGAAFARITGAIWTGENTARSYPVAVGLAAVKAEIPLARLLPFFLHSFTANLISAAIRLIPLGQTEGQRILTELAPLIALTAAKAEHGDLDQLSSTAFLSDIAAMHHETLEPRIFQS